jgi:hypothetical protein
MAHFAELNENNIVTRVIVVNNENILDENGNESEEVGILFCRNLLGENTRWTQTSYNNTFRKRYAGVGFFYDEENDVFITPKPFNSWVLNAEFDWEAPIEYPSDGNYYYWNEDALGWEVQEREI